jgi:hypothetical protein
MISLPDEPTAESDPFTISSVSPVSSPPLVSSLPAGKTISAPGSMVSVTPTGTVTSPVRVTVPVQVSSAGITPDVVAARPRPDVARTEKTIKENTAKKPFKFFFIFLSLISIDGNA